jgi:hypothetical protein
MIEDDTLKFSLRCDSRQAAWQKNRGGLSRPDKIRMVETLRGSLRLLRVLKTAGKDPAKNNRWIRRNA